MRLTNELAIELATIEERIEYLNREVLFPLGMASLKLGTSPLQYGEELNDIVQEMNSYKLQMENILCETDKKEQDQLLMACSL